MTPTRRSFLRGAVSLAGAVVTLKLPTWLPTLYGDGLHDDTAALNALFSGGDLIVADDRLRISKGRFPILGPGRFIVTDTVTIPPEARIVGPTIDLSRAEPGRLALVWPMPEAGTVLVEGIHIAHRDRRRDTYLEGMSFHRSPEMGRRLGAWSPALSITA